MDNLTYLDGREERLDMIAHVGREKASERPPVDYEKVVDEIYELLNKFDAGTFGATETVVEIADVLYSAGIDNDTVPEYLVDQTKEAA